MQYQGRTPTPSDYPSQPELSRLAGLSPIGSVESIALTFLVLCGTITLCFSQQLFPALGTLGAFVLIVGLSLIFERLIRPLVMWGLGSHVYRSLTKLGGKAMADEVARIYGAGSTITTAQLNRLIERSAKARDRDVGDAT
ncbi:hypothetical protein [Pseudomonas sp. MWU12-2323]|uniref:hypothetical protein n=1 Tax=Pseudomonas sp. MWU12-2323 TaxID=2651296 RepID=UPI00128BEB20|nr:hypothetical protein [Pseudomonas sp. MWU12-2323]MPQ71502.1 hypothetical protein [Pseudomonas sp. MWU12-2323]